MDRLPEELLSAIILPDLYPYVRHGYTCLPPLRRGLCRRLVCRSWKRIVDGCVAYWSRVVLQYDLSVATASEALVKILSQRNDRLVNEQTETLAQLNKYIKRVKRQKK